MIVQLVAKPRHYSAQLNAAFLDGAGQLRRLNFIQRARALGFSSEQLRGLLNLHAPGENHTRAAVKSLTESHIDTIADKIRDLQRIKRRLSQISSFCDGSSQSADTCPILKSLFDDS